MIQYIAGGGRYDGIYSFGHYVAVCACEFFVHKHKIYNRIKRCASSPSLRTVLLYTCVILKRFITRSKIQIGYRMHTLYRLPTDKVSRFSSVNSYQPSAAINIALHGAPSAPDRSSGAAFKKYTPSCTSDKRIPSSRTTSAPKRI